MDTDLDREIEDLRLWSMTDLECPFCDIDARLDRLLLGQILDFDPSFFVVCDRESLGFGHVMVARFRALPSNAAQAWLERITGKTAVLARCRAQSAARPCCQRCAGHTRRQASSACSAPLVPCRWFDEHGLLAR